MKDDISAPPRGPRALVHSIASPAFITACLILLILLAFAGTACEAFHGVDETRRALFDAWYFRLPIGLPLPAGRTLFFALALSLTARLLLGLRSRPDWAGPWLIELGALTLVTSLFVFPSTVTPAYVTLHAGEVASTAQSGDTSIPLPFSIRLLDFQKERYPGSDKPRRFVSRVEVQQASTSRTVSIEMNRPLRLGDYSLYQFSYAEPAAGQTESTLAVVRNRVRFWPYLASLLVAAGTLTFTMRRRTERQQARGTPGPAAPGAPIRHSRSLQSFTWALALLALGFAAVSVSGALRSRPEDSLALTPVLSGGRVMPLDTLARQRLQQDPSRPAIPARDEGPWLAPTDATPATNAPTAALRQEVLLNRLAPFDTAAKLYALAAIASAMRVFVGRRVSWTPVLLMALLGFALHTSGLVLRVLITGHPPVTNLYSTFVFVAWAAALLSLLADGRPRSGTFLLVGSLIAATLLVVADRTAGRGDTLGQLAPVLNANWWLGVHVVTIMIGFAACLLTGLIGHAYLVRSCLIRRDTASLDPTLRTMTTLLLVGLAFAFFGTVLGGLWADCSWGRFWGWDPKENGALIVILWCVAILYARKGRLIGDFGMATGCAAITVMIALAWLGVNLLGVGLHSYGSVSGVAFGLFLFVGFEMMLIGGLYLLCTARQCPSRPPDSSGSPTP